MIDEVQRTDLRTYIRLLLALGEGDFDSIVEQGTEYLEDAPGARSLAREFAVEEFTDYTSAQQTWPDVLDSDRLLRAFRDLDLAGILARVQNSRIRQDRSVARPRVSTVLRACLLIGCLSS